MVAPKRTGTRFASLEIIQITAIERDKMTTRTARKSSARSRGRRATTGRTRRGNNGNSRSEASLRQAELKRVRSHPKPPLPKQHQEYPGLEAKLHPRPQYAAP